MKLRPILAFALGAGLGSATLFGVGWTHGQTPPTPSLRSDPVSFRDVVKSVMPAVVSIEARSVTRQPASSDFIKFFDELEKRSGKEVPRPRRDRAIGFGSGFIVDAKGIVLTNLHVVKGADEVEITLPDDRKFISTDIKGDERTDLAILRFDSKGTKLPSLQFGDAGEMEIGDRVLALGAPFGLSGTVTHGIISAKKRDIGLNRYDDFIQTDAAINPGNSGGPLVNLDGKVVGVNSVIQSRSGGFQGVSLAISSNMAKKVFESLARDGIVKRPYIGIEAVTLLTNEAAERLKLPVGAIVIAAVREKTPSARAGIQPLDVLTSIDGKQLREFRELTKIIGDLPLTATIDVGLIRDGQKKSVKLTLEEEPTGYLEARFTEMIDSKTVSSERVGLEVASFSWSPASGGPSQPRGAIIKNVESGSAAERAGLRVGMVIRSVNKKMVSNAKQAQAAFEEAAKDEGFFVAASTSNRGTILFYVDAN